MAFLEWLSEKVLRGTTAVLKDPFLLIGLMVMSLVVKRFAVPASEGSDGRARLVLPDRRR